MNIVQDGTHRLLELPPEIYLILGLPDVESARPWLSNVTKKRPGFVQNIFPGSILAGEIVQRADALQAEMALYAGVRRGTLNLGIITSLQCIDFGGLYIAHCEKLHPPSLLKFI